MFRSRGCSGAWGFTLFEPCRGGVAYKDVKRNK